MSQDIADNPNYVAIIDNDNFIISASKTFCEQICSLSKGHECPAQDAGNCAQYCVKFQSLFIERDSKVFLQNQFHNSDHRRASYEVNHEDGFLVKIATIRSEGERIKMLCKIPDVFYSGQP